MIRESQGSSVEELKSQLNIVDVISRAVPLKRAGANYKGVCPFHNEKTPSFVVSEQKQIFSCFGCGASGDVIGFTERYYNLEFREAVEKLAAENGIPVNFGSSRNNKEKEKYYEINKQAARFFYRAFTEGKNPGYTYMKQRGIDDAILKKFGIGYADEKWDSLYLFLKNQGVDEKILLELGLISEKNGKYYDKFRNRVMFPIINTGGKIIGFGGRILGDGKPKYLNSSENRVFQKKNNLYALNLSRQDVGKESYAVIVEGYMDAISLYQHGIRNVCASLGTALTENQARLLRRYTGNVVLSYDADSAGRSAALRGIDILGKEDFKVRVLHVPDGKDPDEFLKNHGKGEFLKLIDQAMPMIDYKLANAGEGLDLSSEEGKLDYMKKASVILRNLSPIEADIYIKKIARDLKISEGAIRMEIMGNHNVDAPKNVYVPESHAEHDVTRRREEALSGLEATILKALLVNPSFSEILLENEEVMESSLGKKIMNVAFELYGLKGDFDRSDIMDRLEPEESQSMSLALSNVIIAGNEEKVLHECLCNWKLSKLLSREKELIDRISLADEETGNVALDELTRELMEVQTEINSYGGRN